MSDRATPTLPSRDFAATSAFYSALGFTESYRDDGWMILSHGGVTLEFFPFADLDPATSGFSCCLRLDDADAFHAACLRAGVPETTRGWPRAHAVRLEASGMRIGALVDPDGTLLRLVQNPDAAATAAPWPLADLRLRVGDTSLRPVREADLPRLASLQPDDYEHDPSAEAWPGEGVSDLRRRLVHQGHWRSLGTWSPASWCLEFAVEHRGELVGVQSLEADDFPDLRTVDSGSWLVATARGRGVGVAMRTAVLALAFDHLGALAAVTSARTDNAASLGVSRRLGYRDNGVSLNRSGRGIVELTHLRLTADRWRASGAGERVEVKGVGPRLPWFGLPAPN